MDIVVVMYDCVITIILLTVILSLGRIFMELLRFPFWKLASHSLSINGIIIHGLGAISCCILTMAYMLTMFIFECFVPSF